MSLWCSLLSRHNNYISRALSLQPIQRFSIQCLDPYLNVMWLAFINSIGLVILCSYNSFLMCYRKPVVRCAWASMVSPASSCLSVYRPAHTCGVSPKASKAIKNSSVARWCFLNQFCVIFQMHSASLRERDAHTRAHTHTEEQEMSVFWKLVSNL